MHPDVLPVPADSATPFILRYGSWIAFPAFWIMLVFLVFFIVRVVRLVRQSYIVRVPVAERQEVEFAEPGRVDLCLEGPRFTTRFGKLNYELSTQDGAPVQGHIALFRTTTSGIDTVRMRIRTYDIRSPGRHVLRVKGLPADWTPDVKYQIVFMKPHTVRAIGYVIGITLSAGLLIASLVLFILSLVFKGKGA